jgi:hypothetical protein
MMESPFVDSIRKFFHTNSKYDCSKPTLIDYGVEYFIEYSKPKLFLMDSNSKFVVIPKLVATSSKMYCLVKFLLFGWFLSKFD